MGLRPRCFQTRRLPLTARSPPPPPSRGRRRARRGAKGSSPARERSQGGSLPVGGGGSSAARGAFPPHCRAPCRHALGGPQHRAGEKPVDLFFGAPWAALQGGGCKLTAPVAGLGYRGLPGPAAAAAVPPSAPRSLAPPNTPATAPKLAPRAAAKPWARRSEPNGSPRPAPRGWAGLACPPTLRQPEAPASPHPTWRLHRRKTRGADAPLLP